MRDLIIDLMLFAVGPKISKEKNLCGWDVGGRKDTQLLVAVRNYPAFRLLSNPLLASPYVFFFSFNLSYFLLNNYDVISHILPVKKQKKLAMLRNQVNSEELNK